jgi:hypothetical protein
MPRNLLEARKSPRNCTPAWRSAVRSDERRLVRISIRTGWRRRGTRFGARLGLPLSAVESVRQVRWSGSINGMTSMKVAVSLPRETFERAKRAVGRGRAASLSAYVTAALDQKATFDELNDLLDEMLAETGGPMTVVEEKRIDRLIRGPKRRAKK